MKRMAVLGCTLLVVAGCGGGGSSNVEEMMQVDPAEPETGSMEPATSPTLSTLGAYQSAPIDDVGDAFTAVFHRWGVWGGILRDDAVTCHGHWLSAGGRHHLYGVHQPRDGWDRQHDDARHAVGNLARDGERCLDRRCQGLRNGRHCELRGGRPSQPMRRWKATRELRSISGPLPSMSISRTSTIAGRTCLGTGLPWTTASSGMKPRA